LLIFLVDVFVIEEEENMKRITVVLFALALITPAFGRGGAQAAGGGSGSGGPKVVRDGVFRNAYSSEFTTLDYNNTSTSAIGLHGNLTSCTLVEWDEYTILRPNLATGWTVSPDGLVYTFKLRNDVNWYTSKGEVWGPATARDFVETAKWMLIKENACAINNNLIAMLKNAKEFNDGTITDFNQVGIYAPDDYTLVYTLLRPTPYFLSALTYTSFYPSPGKFRAEMGKNYGTSNDTLLYSGPYIMTVFDPENRRVYERNEKYWNAQRYPLKTIEEIYNKEAATIGPELYLRGEIDETLIPLAILDEWLKDPEKSKNLYQTSSSIYTNFLAFNFDPRYGAEYGPENWRKAVNNLNFRKSFYHGVNKTLMATTLDANNPDRRMLNTFVLPTRFAAGGMDYTQFPPLRDIADKATYDLRLAQDHKAKAMAELRGAVTFPVKVVMPYDTGDPSLVNRVQLLEQQMERDLGTDYIDVVLVPYPSTGYLTNTRNAGVFSFFETRWGPDYADPMSVLDPFNADIAVGTRYGRVYLAEEGLGPDGKPVFQSLLIKADAEVLDIVKRYTLFAEAERYLIDNAYALPYYLSGFDYYVSRLDPFSGLSTRNGPIRTKYAGKALLDRPYTTEEYKAAEARFNQAREAALKAEAGK
jgi:oligopeptide transport system substrate-binding protein